MVGGEGSCGEAYGHCDNDVEIVAVDIKAFFSTSAPHPNNFQSHVHASEEGISASEEGLVGKQQSGTSSNMQAV